MQRDRADAMAIAALDTVTLTPVLNKVVRAGLPVVTFDSDAPESDRAAYVGTENFGFGVQLAKLAKQLSPSGGTYVTFYSSEADNLIKRMQGVEAELKDDPLWTAISLNPIDTKGETDILSSYYAIARLPEPPTVAISTMYVFMNAPGWKDYIDEFNKVGIKHVTADASELQLEYLATGYADALLAQLPYEFGILSVDVLYQLHKGKALESDMIATGTVSHILNPAALPDLALDEHLLGRLSILGLVICPLLILVIGAQFKLVPGLSQNHFAMATLVGAGTLSTVLIPISLELNGEEMEGSTASAQAVCMSVPWLGAVSIGLVTTALWNVAQTGSTTFTGINPVSAVALLLQFVLLVVWSVVDPLTFVREDRGARDPWDRCKLFVAMLLLILFYCCIAFLPDSHTNT